MPAANLRTARVDHRFAENQSGKRKAVIVIREIIDHLDDSGSDLVALQHFALHESFAPLVPP